MVYIHGGGWLAGTGSNYQPTYLLDKDVILVTFNYRLGPLGMNPLAKACFFLVKMCVRKKLWEMANI
jgi:carboxylesterase type B